MSNRRALPLATWPQAQTLAAIAIVAGFLALSLAGCTSQPKKQPATIKEFLAQPRPE